MKTLENTIHVDGLRFISSLNTQVRTIVTVSQIVKILGSKQLPKLFLKRALQKWSAEEEKLSIEYKNHRGKVTKEGGKPTTAFNRYLEFSASLGLITIHDDIIMNSRLGRLLSKFAQEPKKVESQLNNAEKLFYLIILFRNDADALLLSLELLQYYSKPVTQKLLLKLFEDKLKERLLLKQKHASEQAQLAIHDKYQGIEYTWEEAESYSKHIIPPRLEWMKDLGILIPTKGDSFYQLTEEGNSFYNSLLRFPDSDKREVNENWFRTKAMTSFVPLVLSKKSFIYWPELDQNQQLRVLAPLLKNAFNLFDTEGVRRISLYPSLLFITISLAYQRNIIAEFQELEGNLKKSIIVENKKYSARLAARVNEGYITMNLV